MRDKNKVGAKIVIIILIALVYLSLIFAPPGKLREYRDIYIETAMTTSQHKWLATAFFPEKLINEVMSQKVNAVKALTEQSFSPSYMSDFKKRNSDILQQKHLLEGSKNKHGHTLLINDKEEKILIYKIKTNMYTGFMVLVAEPDRVWLKNTPYKDKNGQTISQFCDKNNILAINASAYKRMKEAEDGGTVAGLCYSDGESWGEYDKNNMSLGFLNNDKFAVGSIKNWEEYGFRDAIQFSPALIINSEVITQSTNGWGLQPRTCIGQREDGVVLFLVIDGRQIGYSYGATIENCIEEMLKYEAINAACCDGGSSTALSYKGELINIPSAKGEDGMALPNAWAVRSRNGV